MLKPSKHKTVRHKRTTTTQPTTPSWKKKNENNVFGRVKTPLFQARLFEETIWANLSISNRAAQRRRFSERKKHSDARKPSGKLSHTPRKTRSLKSDRILKKTIEKQRTIIPRPPSNMNGSIKHRQHHGSKSKVSVSRTSRVNKSSHKQQQGQSPRVRYESIMRTPPRNKARTMITTPRNGSRNTLTSRSSSTTQGTPILNNNTSKKPKDFWTSYYSLLMGESPYNNALSSDAYVPQSILAHHHMNGYNDDDDDDKIPDFLELNVSGSSLIIPSDVLNDNNNNNNNDDDDDDDDSFRVCIYLYGTTPVNNKFQFISRTEIVNSTDRNPNFHEHLYICTYGHPILKFIVYYLARDDVKYTIGLYIVAVKDLWKQQKQKQQQYNSNNNNSNNSNDNNSVVFGLSHDNILMQNKLNSNYSRLSVKARIARPELVSAYSNNNNNNNNNNNKILTPSHYLEDLITHDNNKNKNKLILPFGAVLVSINLTLRGPSSNDPSNNNQNNNKYITLALYIESIIIKTETFDYCGQISLATPEIKLILHNINNKQQICSFPNSQICFMVYGHDKKCTNISLLPENEKILLGYAPFSSFNDLLNASDMNDDDDNTVYAPLLSPMRRGAHNLGDIAIKYNLETVAVSIFDLNISISDIILSLVPTISLFTISVAIYGYPYLHGYSLCSRSTISIDDSEIIRVPQKILITSLAGNEEHALIRIQLHAREYFIGQVIVNLSELYFLSKIGMSLKFPLQTEENNVTGSGSLLLHLKNHNNNNSNNKSIIQRESEDVILQEENECIKKPVSVKEEIYNNNNNDDNNDDNNDNNQNNNDNNDDNNDDDDNNNQNNNDDNNDDDDNNNQNNNQNNNDNNDDNNNDDDNNNQNNQNNNDNNNDDDNNNQNNQNNNDNNNDDDNDDDDDELCLQDDESFDF